MFGRQYILATIDVRRYRSIARPRWAGARMITWIPKVVWLMRACIWNMLWSVVAPDRAHRGYRRRVETYERMITSELDYDLPLDDFRRRYAAPMFLSLIHI